MKKKIITTIDLASKIFNIIIFHKLYKFINWLTVIFILINLQKLCLSKIKINNINNLNLAFHINIPNFKQSIIIFKHITKIEIEQLNSILLKRMLTKNYIILEKKLIYDIKITQIIDKLQNSGFFNKIEYFIINIDNKKHLVINLNINALVKKFLIHKYHQLKIPKKLLIKLFKYQLGLPKNYKYINNSIQQIYAWYRKRGFEWIHIELEEDKIENNIKIIILEGQIIKNKFIYENNTNINLKFNQKIEKIIEKTLKIMPGSILNIKRLDAGINNLQNIKLISNFTYNVYQDQKGLILKIQYSIPQNRKGSFYQKNNTNNVMLLQIFMPYIKFTKHKIVNVKTMFFNLQQNIKMILLHKNLGFKYFSIKQNVYYQNLIINIKLINKIPQVNISLSYPRIKINKNIFAEILLNIYNTLYKKDSLSKFERRQLNYLSSLKTKNNKIYLKSSGILILYKHHIYSKIYLTENILETYNLYDKKSFNLSKYYIANAVDNNNYKLKVLKTSIKQKLLYLQIKLKYTTFQFTHELKSGKLFIVKFIYLTFYPLKNINTFYQNRYSSQSIKITYNQILTFPKIIPYIRKNALVIFGEIDWPIGLNKYKPIFGINNLNKINLYIEDSLKQQYTFYIKYLSNVEYHIPINNYLSSYFFFQYSNKQKYITSKTQYIANNYKASIGLGLQLSIPIKKIPKLRFEYGINNYTKNFCQLRVFSSYTN